MPAGLMHCTTPTFTLALHYGQCFGIQTDLSWIEAVADATVREGAEGLSLGLV